MPFDVISNVDYRYSSIKIDKFQYVCINGYLFRNIYRHLLSVRYSCEWT